MVRAECAFVNAVLRKRIRAAVLRSYERADAAQDFRPQLSDALDAMDVSEGLLRELVQMVMADPELAEERIMDHLGDME